MSFKKEFYDKGYQQSVNDLEVRTLRRILARLNDMNLNGQTIDQGINELTREILTLEKPLDPGREDRLSYDPLIGKFIPYFLT